MVRRAQEDPVEFAGIYARYRLPVFRYLRSMEQSEEDAAELTAVTFERALRALPKYRARGGGLGAWLFRIARNAALDEGKRRKRRLPDPSTDSALNSLAALPGPAEAVELRIAVNSLPSAEREAILLRFAAGLTAREIGFVMGKSGEASQKLIERALLRLKEDLR